MAALRTNGDTAILPRHAHLSQALKPEAAQLAERGTDREASIAREAAGGATWRRRRTRPMAAQQARSDTTGRMRHNRRDVAKAAPRYSGCPGRVWHLQVNGGATSRCLFERAEGYS